MISSLRTAPSVRRTLAAEPSRHTGERVTVQGWLHRRRTLKSVVFLVLRDRSGLAQAVFG